MKLIVAEKPSVGRAIAEAVGADRKVGKTHMEGGGYLISWCHGHLVDLVTPDGYAEWSGRWDASKLPMIPPEWKWGVLPASEEQFEALRGLMSRPDVNGIVNACDADREGEGIFRRVYALAGCGKPVCRLWSTSLVPEQILRDLEAARPMSDYDGLAGAAEGRAKADWLVGMNASRAYSCLYSAKISAGRVQTPTLALVVERTRLATAFKSTPFWQVALDLGGFTVFGERRDSKDEADAIAASALNGVAKVTLCERKQEKNRAPRLYDLTGLQRDASTRAGLTAEQTLSALQALYEAKLATYPRTESQFIGEADRGDAERVLKAVSDPGVSGAAARAFDMGRADVSRVVDDSKVHGHGAILPTALVTPDAMKQLSGAERQVMQLVCARLLTAVMESATRVRVKIEAECGGRAYAASGSQVTDASWIAVDDAARAMVAGGGEEADGADDAACQRIPESVSKDDELAVVEAEVKEGKTSPPKPYTDASLLSAMANVGRSIEDRELKAAIEDDSSHSGGLGTPATRAATIEKLIADGYIARKGRTLVATERGYSVIDTVSSTLKSPELTARWELELSRVEKGEADLTGFMDGIEAYTSQIVKEAKEGFDPGKLSALCGAEAVGACPLCGKPVVRTGGVFQCSSNRFSPAEDGYKLLEGCGFKLFAKQCKKLLTTAQVKQLLDGKTVHLTGLSKKDGSTFEADAELGDAPYEGWVRFCKRKGSYGARTGRGKARRGGGRW